MPAQLARRVEDIDALARSLAWDQVRHRAGQLLGQERLPADLRSPLQALHQRATHLDALQRLRAMVGQPWSRPPDAATVQQHLNELGSPHEVAALRQAVRRYLVCRAHLEGHRALAGQLDPTARDSPAPVSLLRDLKVAASAATT